MRREVRKEVEVELGRTQGRRRSFVGIVKGRKEGRKEEEIRVSIGVMEESNEGCKREFWLTLWS